MLGNLSAHRERVAADMAKIFPDPAASGVAALDWEVWRPWMVIKSWSVYVNETLAYVAGLHPGMPRAQLEAEAIRVWNASSLEWLVETAKAMKAARPRIQLGVYSYPDCYADRTPFGSDPGCGTFVQGINDALGPLYDVVDVLMPSIYMEEDARTKGGDLDILTHYTDCELAEARRIKAQRGQPIFPFAWGDKFITGPHGQAVPQWEPETRMPLLELSFKVRWVGPWCGVRGVVGQRRAPRAAHGLTHVASSPHSQSPRDKGADGLIVWGSSSDSSNVSMCRRWSDFFEGELGPLIKEASAPRSSVSAAAAR